jgi:hypothetical protein
VGESILIFLLAVPNSRVGFVYAGCEGLYMVSKIVDVRAAADFYRDSICLRGNASVGAKVRTGSLTIPPASTKNVASPSRASMTMP